MSKKTKSQARDELLQLQADISKRLKAELRQLIGEKDPQIRKYYLTYKKEFKQIEAYSSKAELLKSVEVANIVFCGDFHTLRQSQKTPIRILREVVRKRKKISLGLEMVSRADQHYLDLFQQGKLSENNFLAKINYQENWGFSWYNYRELLDFCRQTEIRAVALSPEQRLNSRSLAERTSFAALAVAQEWLENQERLLFVLFGDLHLAQPFLPGKNKKILADLGYKPKYLTIYQNSEKIYWQLAKKNREQSVDVVKLDSNRYCVMSVTPWVMFQSYLSWLEGSSELLTDFQLEGQWREEKDFYHHLYELMQTIAIFLKLPRQKLSDFAVYTPKDLEFVRLRKQSVEFKKPHSDFQLELLKKEIIEEGSCLLPWQKVVCLSNLSMTRASEKAAQLVFAICSANYRAKPIVLHQREIFYRRVYLEMLGYLGSKIVNYKRKSDQLADYQDFLKRHQGVKLSARLRSFRELSNRVIQHKRLEERYLAKGKLTSFPKRLYAGRPAIFLNFSRALGQMLGERLYLALIEGAMAKEEVKHLFTYKFVSAESATKKYFLLVKLLKEIKPLHKKKRQIF